MIQEFLPPLASPVLLEKNGQKTIAWGRADQWVLFAGPDIFESDALVREVAAELKVVTAELGIPWVLKCSFDKANRQSAKSFRGLDVKTTLRSLEKIKQDYNCSLVTDVHDVEQVKMVSEVTDVMQIPAFLCRQTDLIQEAAATGKILHVKKGQFMAPWDMGSIVEKARSVGNSKVLLCERGSSFGYNRLINDMTSLVEMRKFGVPVVMDASHSVQLPGGKGDSSDGRRDMIAVLARAAMAVGIDGLFMETHPDPDRALCDGPNSIHLKDMRGLLTQLQKVWKALKT